MYALISDFVRRLVSCLLRSLAPGRIIAWRAPAGRVETRAVQASGIYELGEKVGWSVSATGAGSCAGRRLHFV